MIDIIFLLVIIALLGYIGYKEWLTKDERKEFFKYMMARNLTEVVNAKVAEKREPEKEKIEDEIPLSELSDDAFEKAIGIK